MKYPKCQFDNREDAEFCNKCGTKLEVACPKYGRSNPTNKTFCDKCGNDLTDSAPSPTQAPTTETPTEEKTKVETLETEPQGERKHVTVLFSDIC
jgi:hypothetical protein